jgi:hypothetical protein
MDTQIRRAAFIGVFTVASLAFNGVTRPVAAQTSPVPLLFLDRPYLDAARARLARGDESLKAARISLEEAAAKALALTPPSVMDKTITPPSGDKHDYMSQAPYWWPDPAKPDGRPYIRRDGERNPEINRITDHDNLGRVTSAVATLGLAYFMTGRSDYATHAARLVRVWFLDPATRMNPHLKFGQGIPGINEGRGIGIIETRGLPEMLDGVRLMTGSPAWTATDDAALQTWMRAYLQWLRESTHGQEEARNGNNHETWYDVQVAGLAIYTGQRDVTRQTLEGSRQRVARQIQPDGRQPRELERTRSWDYSIFNLEAFFDLATLGQQTGVDLWNYKSDDGRSLRQALDFLASYVTSGQKWPDAQITEFRASALHELLRRAAVAWNDPKYRELAAKAGGGTPRIDLTVR